MRQLAVEASNGTNTTTDLQAIQDQINQYSDQIDNIANTTQFNTKNLLDGSLNVTGTSTGANEADVTIVGGTADTQANSTVSMSGATLATVATSPELGVDGGYATTATDLTAASSSITINGSTYSFTNANTVQNVLDTINNAGIGVTAAYNAGGNDGITFSTTATGGSATLAITGVTGDFATTAAAGAAYAGATTTGKNATITGLADGGSNTYTASGNTVTINDPTSNANGLQFTVNGDFAAGVATLTVTDNNGLTLQIGANQNQTMYLGINNMQSAALGVNALNMTTSAGAQDAITTIDNAISTVSSQNSALGAYQDRLQDTSDNLTTTNQNLTSANSTLTDVDMASEMSQYTQDSILVQAATSMLAQAQQEPQTVLKLLQ